MLVMVLVSGGWIEKNDYISEPTARHLVQETMDHFLKTWKRDHPPTWGLVMSPIGFRWQASMSAGPPCKIGLVTVDGGIFVSLSLKDENGGHYHLNWQTLWIGADHVSLRHRFKSRYFCYSMDDEGRELQIEFASKLEARVMAEFIQQHAVGQRDSMSTMPLIPRIRL